MKKHSLKERFNYWFDNRMSRGSIGLIRVLIIFSVLFVFLTTAVIMLCGFNGEQDGAGIFWDSIATIINAWMPAYEDGSIGYLIVMALTAFAGLMVTSVLIGIVTSAIEEKIVGLRKGNSPVLEEDHFVIIGFYAGEYTLIRQLILAAGDKPCTIVIGSEMERDEMEQYIKDNIEKPKNVKIICRTIDPFDPKSIERLSVETSRTIIISPADDSTTVKTLLAVSALIQNTKGRNVRVNAITQKDENRFPPTIAKKHNVTTLQTNDTLAKIIAHSCTQTGLSEVFKEIFNFEGSELYLIQREDQAGLSFMELLSRMDCASPIGVYRDHEIVMNPPKDLIIEQSDRLLVFSEERDSAVLNDHGKLIELGDELAPIKPERNTKTLIFGQNDTLKTVLRELPENVQKVTLVNYDGTETARLQAICDRRGMELDFVEGNIRSEMGLLEVTRKAEHVIILSDHDSDEEEADMNTIFMLLNLRELRMKYRLHFNITTEMRREKNQSLVVSDDYTDFVVASNMSSLFLAQLAESPRLISAFREILSNEGNEIYMKNAANLYCVGDFTVSELRQILYAQGYIFMGYMSADNHYRFNPPLDEAIHLRNSDSLIVLGEN